MSDEATNAPQTPGAPEQPAQPVQPATPEQPVEPAQPATPEVPQPAAPGQPAQPAQPQQPAQPAQPAQPQQPAQPAQPAQPVSNPCAQQPAQPAQPYAAAYSTQQGVPIYGQPAVQQPQNNGKAVGALICGICSIVFSGTVLISLILGIVAIVLAGQYIRQFGKEGKATGAKICGIIGIVFSVIALIAYIAMFAIGIAALNYAYDACDNYDDLYDYSYSSSNSGSSSSSNSSSSSSSSSSSADLDSDEQAVMNAAEEALLNLDSDSAFVETWASQADTLFTDATDGVSLSDIGIDPVEFIHWMAESVEVDTSDPILSGTGDSAIAFIDVENYDVPSFALALLQAIPDDVTASSEEEAYEYLKQYAQEALNTTELAECTVSLDLTQENGQWVVSEDSINKAADLMFYLTED